MPFARGFRTRCENIAEQVRRDIGLIATAPLSIEQLASTIGVQLLTPGDVRGMPQESLDVLLRHKSDSWSAVTVSCGSVDVVVYNPTSSSARTASDVAHEIAHLLLAHEPSTLSFVQDGTWTIRSYNQGQEDEAAWLGGCLLLPRVALIDLLSHRASDADACARFGVSQALLQYRRNITGVARQQALRAARPPRRVS